MKSLIGAALMFFSLACPDILRAAESEKIRIAAGAIG